MSDRLEKVKKLFKEFDRQTIGFTNDDPEEDYVLQNWEMNLLRDEINHLLKEVDDAYPEVGWSIPPKV